MEHKDLQDLNGIFNSIPDLTTYQIILNVKLHF